MAKRRPRATPRHTAPVHEKAPAIVSSIADALVVKDEDLYFLCRPDGEVPLRGGHGFGLYFHDCRYLSGYELKLGGERAQRLATVTRTGFNGMIELCNLDMQLPDGQQVRRQQIGLSWNRVLYGEQHTLLDEIAIENHGQETVELPLTLSFRADFEDIFAVRGILGAETEAPEGDRHEPRWRGEDELGFAYDGADGIRRSLSLHFSPAPARREKAGAHFVLRLACQEKVSLRVSIALWESAVEEFAAPAASRHANIERLTADLHRSTEEGLVEQTEIETDNLLLNRVLWRAQRDLQALRSRLRHHEFFAAGVPWYATLFGRDSLISAYQTLAYDARMAAETLRLLATYQGQCVDPWRDEEPGKILHELRVGEFARMGKIPYSPYYGTIDATPLFLILLGAHAEWTGSLALFQELEESVTLALGWMASFGDRDDDGYLEYHSESSHGLNNHGWKDSGDAIVNADGSLATPPIALVEVQGYMYRAKLSVAGLYERAGEKEKARTLRREAAALKKRFNREFWLKSHQFFALALQAAQRPVEVASSNPGQALWSGIVERAKAKRVVERLMSPAMFSGWGIRTLSTNEVRYNPIGYHLGTVWPHDNALIAAGMRCYGFDEEAERIFLGLFEAVSHFDLYRMPELFSGIAREPFGEPVRYPVACHPQAWAAGALPFLLQVMLGLEPDAFAHTLRVRRPRLPPFVDRVRLSRLVVGSACVDLAFVRGKAGIEVEVLRQEGPLTIETELER